MALNTVNIRSPLRWETKFAFSLNRDKITKLYGSEVDKDIVNSWFVGEPISSIYDYTMTGGVWTEQELYNKEITTKGYYPGNWRLADLNGDGAIDPNNDRSIIGYATPNYRFSINNTLSYKNFTLNIFINSIMGGDGYFLQNNADLVAPSSSTDNVQRVNQYTIRQYWTPDNGVDNCNGLFYSPPYVAGVYEDRSFVRLKDISLNYSFGKRMLDALKLMGCDIFLSGKNLYTWTKWSGWDPETTLITTSTYNTPGAPLAYTTSADTEPMMKSIIAGVRLSW